MSLSPISSQLCDDDVAECRLVAEESNDTENDDPLGSDDDVAKDGNEIANGDVGGTKK